MGSEKIGDIELGPGGVPIKKPIVVPKGIDPERFHQASKAKAAMRTETTPGGSVLVRCPYCIIFWRLVNMVDVTKFIDKAGKKQVTTECSKGHKLVFKAIDHWREERQRMGLQVRS